jgi:ABC-type sulfate transport system permease component
MRSILPSVLAIAICGGFGATFAWFLVDTLGWTGVAGAIATAILGMFIAVAMFAVGVALAKALRPRH